MTFKIVFTMLAFLSLVIFPAELLTSQHVVAFQSPQKEKREAEPGIRSPEQAQEDVLKPLKDAYPVLFKVKPVAKNDDELRKLQIDRFLAAEDYVAARYVESAVGPGGPVSLVHLLEADRLLLDSRLDLVEKIEEEIAVREDFLKIAKEIEKTTKTILDAGKMDRDTFVTVQHIRNGAEIQLLKAKRKLKK